MTYFKSFYPEFTKEKYKQSQKVAELFKFSKEVNNRFQKWTKPPEKTKAAHVNLGALISCKALAKRTHKWSQVEDSGLLAAPIGQALRTYTCVDLR